MVSCTLPEIASWWENKGVKVEQVFTDGEASYWRIEVQEGDERLKDPEYVQLVIREQLYVVAQTLKKFSPPLFFLRKDGIPTNMTDDTGVVFVAVSKDKDALWSLMGEETAGISTGKCETYDEVIRYLSDSLESGASQAAFVLRVGLVERFDLKQLLRIIHEPSGSPRTERPMQPLQPAKWL